MCIQCLGLKPRLVGGNRKFVVKQPPAAPSSCTRELVIIAELPENVYDLNFLLDYLQMAAMVKFPKFTLKKIG